MEITYCHSAEKADTRIVQKVSQAKFCQFARLFALDLDATQIAELNLLNRNTVNHYLRGVRKRIGGLLRCAGTVRQRGRGQLALLRCGGSGFSKSQASRLCVAIDERVHAIWTGRSRATGRSCGATPPT